MNTTIIILVLLIGSLFLGSCKVPETTVPLTPVPEETVDDLGEYLASWANAHCTNIEIDNEPILIEDGNAGGCSQVWWQHPEGVAFEEQGDEMPAAIRPGAERWHQDNETVSGFLTEKLQASDCNLDLLLREAALFSERTSPAELSRHLSCLGEVSFVAVEFGTE